MTENDLEHLIRLSKVVAKPWFISTILLAILLAVSVCGNIYMASAKSSITIEADNNIESVM